MRVLTLLSVALFWSGLAYAESLPLEYGVKAGFNLAQHYGTKADETEYKVETAMRPGIMAGAFLNYKILDHVRLGYELFYTMKGSREKVTILSVEGETLAQPAVMNLRYDLDYLEMPIALRVRAYSSPKFSVEAVTGTAFSLKIHGRHELDGTFYLPNGDGFDVIPVSEESDLSYVNMFDYSLVYGLALQCHGKMELSSEFRFTLGWDYLSLPTYSLAEPAELRNQTYSLILSAQF